MAAPRSSSGCRLRARDPDVVDGRLDRACATTIGCREDDADRLTGPPRHRDPRRRPGRQVGPRRPELLRHHGPSPRGVLDVGPEIVGGRRVRAVGQVVAERERARGRWEDDRLRADGRHASVDIVRMGRRAGLRAGHQIDRARRRRAGLPTRGSRVRALPRAPRGRVGPERVRRPAAIGLERVV